MSKKKILVISDNPCATSGVATATRWLLYGLINTGRYTFRCLGAALKNVSYETIVPHPDLVIKPIDGFGDPNLIRQLLVSEKPDAMLLVSDPRFHTVAWNMEDEIHQFCPIAYWQLWDAPQLPFDPDFNAYVYESCDLLHSINHPTHEFVSRHWPEKSHYSPHAVPREIYHPLPAHQVIPFKQRLLGQHRLDHFTLLYVSRNARRKRTPDILWAFKLFLEELERQHGHKRATIVMHTHPMDPEGTNLHAVVDKLGIKDSVVFSQNQVQFEDMALLYNSCDALVNASSAEGFGLGVLEMKMCGKPVVGMMTGGVARQVKDHITGEEFGVAMPVEIETLVGTLNIPYITDSLNSVQSISSAYMKLFEMGSEKRAEIGQRAMEHAHRDYDLPRLVESWDRTLHDTIENWRSRRAHWQHIEI